MQTLEEAEAQARRAVIDLGPAYLDDGCTLSEEDRQRLREAFALLRRNHKISRREMVVRLADRSASSTA